MPVACRVVLTWPFGSSYCFVLACCRTSFTARLFQGESVSRFFRPTVLCGTQVSKFWVRLTR